MQKVQLEWKSETIELNNNKNMKTLKMNEIELN